MREALRPDKLLIIPTNIPPHKAMEPGRTLRQGWRLCRIAFPGIPARRSPHGDGAPGQKLHGSYRAQLREKYPEDELFLVVGSDMFLSFREWHEFKYLLDNCTWRSSRARRTTGERYFIQAQALKTRTAREDQAHRARAAANEFGGDTRDAAEGQGARSFWTTGYTR